ncbi:MAG: DUF1778 domain-containing protein [Planctomycetota bacterium]
MPSKTERLEVRIRPEHKELIERAAAASGQVVSQFVIPILVRRAEKVLRRSEQTFLVREDREAFLRITESDDGPTPALTRARERYDAEVREE